MPRRAHVPKRHRFGESGLRLGAVRAAGGLRAAVGLQAGAAWLAPVSVPFEWPGLHNLVQRMPPVVAQPSPLSGAPTRFNWLSASGTACLLAGALSALLVGMSPRQFAEVLRRTVRQLLLPMLTIAAVLALAFLMNYSGATATLGLAFAATGALFPFFSALLGWLGVFLTGSDTSANALFGNLQVVTARRAGHEPGADGGVELRRRRDGQDDQPPEHRGGGRGHRHEARGRSATCSASR